MCKKKQRHNLFAFLVVAIFMLSIIIPTYNESRCIRSTIKTLWEHDTAGLIQQVLVCDGGSTDGTTALAKAEGVDVVHCIQKGRSAQMNAGARRATAPVLYFLHADTLPPKGFTNDIQLAVEKGHPAGCFRLRFDHDHWFLKANCWFTRFDVDAIRFGDQSLFVKRELFFSTGGFREDLVVMEDQDLVKRLKQHCGFIVLDKAVITSARKYLENGIYKTQGIFFVIYAMYRLGFTQEKMVAAYRKMIRQDKL